MKKLLVFFTAAAVVICSTAVGGLASDTLALNISSSAEAVAGGELYVDIAISQNPGIMGGQLRLEFDNTVLTPVSIEKSSAFSSFALTSNADREAGVDFSRVNYVTAILSKDSPTNVNTEDTLFTVKFNVSDSAPAETTLSLSNIGFYNSDYDKVACSPSDLTVTITGGQELPEETEAPSSTPAATPSVAPASTPDVTPGSSCSIDYKQDCAVISSSVAGKYLLIAVAYENSRLVNIRVKPVEFQGAYTITEPLGNIVSAKADIVPDTLKLFLWEGLNGIEIVPACSSYTFDLSNGTD